MAYVLFLMFIVTLVLFVYKIWWLSLIVLLVTGFFYSDSPLDRKNEDLDGMEMTGKYVAWVTMALLLIQIVMAMFKL